jgi:hypothetical protein
VSLAGVCVRRRLADVDRRPIVPSEHERGEVDPCELDQALGVVVPD